MARVGHTNMTGPGDTARQLAAGIEHLRRRVPARDRARFTEEWTANLNGAADLGIDLREVLDAASAQAARLRRRRLADLATGRTGAWPFLLLAPGTLAYLLCFGLTIYSGLAPSLGLIEPATPGVPIDQGGYVLTHYPPQRVFEQLQWAHLMTITALWAVLAPWRVTPWRVRILAVIGFLDAAYVWKCWGPELPTFWAPGAWITNTQLLLACAIGPYLAHHILRERRHRQQTTT